jgi:hypothetical protein
LANRLQGACLVSRACATSHQDQAIDMGWVQWVWTCLRSIGMRRNSMGGQVVNGHGNRGVWTRQQKADEGQGWMGVRFSGLIGIVS